MLVNVKRNNAIYTKHKQGIKTGKKAKLSIVIKHFIELNPTAYKMIDLVRYIRSNRNRLFPNDYKNSNQKFIKVFGWNRTTSVAFYIVKSGLFNKYVK